MREKPTKDSIYKTENDEQFLSEFNSLLSINSDKKSNKNEEKTLFKNENLNLKITQQQNDSDDDDDDLIPYDLSNDVPLSNSKQPKYLRDCLDGNLKMNLISIFLVKIIVELFF